MGAKEMRLIAEKRVSESVEKWWSERFKDRLFNEIQQRAESGDFKLYIRLSDKLNSDDLLGNNRLQVKVKEEVEKLGYQYHFYTGSYQSDGDDREITISW